MTKFFEKHETLFCMLLIVVYVVTNSVCIQNFGFTSLASVILNTSLSLFLLALILALKRTDYYGLKKVENPKKYLFFIPPCKFVFNFQR